MTVKVNQFVWLREIIEKLLSKHDISPEEVEEIFFNHPRIRFHEKGHVQGENMYNAMGRTDAGRYLMVFFILKERRRALIISARDMDRNERRQYVRK
jgi:uncharacterized DUF497 family protein